MRLISNKYRLHKKFEFTEARYAALLTRLDQHRHDIETELNRLYGEAERASDEYARGIQSFTRKYERNLAQVDDLLQFLRC